MISLVVKKMFKTFNILLMKCVFFSAVRMNIPPPLCIEICTCTSSKGNPQFDVKCYTKDDTTNRIFNATNWFNTTGNYSYFYQNISIRNQDMNELNWKFPTMTQLFQLNLSQNRIMNISDGVFSKLQTMAILDLSDNQISVLQPNAFQGLYTIGDYLPLKSLKILKLDGNQLHSLDGDLFEHIERIEVLTLSRNPFKIIDHQTLIAITSLFYLKELDLSSTDLNSLPEHFLHTPRNLQTLNLSSNEFSSVPQTLGEAHNIQILDFSNNPIVNLTKNIAFPKMSALRCLYLSHMPVLERIDQFALNGFSLLKELYIRNNHYLSYIDEKALSDNNGYETWPHLTKLYLSNNSKLEKLDFQFYSNWNELIDLDINNNSLLCECDNQWILDELMSIYVKINPLNAKSLKCGGPIEMVDYTFYQLYVKKTHMRCTDYYGNRPERDATLLIGILSSLLVIIPIVFGLIFLYQRKCLPLVNNNKEPAAFSRRFYHRTPMADEYF